MNKNKENAFRDVPIFSNMTAKKIFVADIGGTNSRFAWFVQKENELTEQQSFCLATRSAHSFPELFLQLRQSGFPTHISRKNRVVIAGAGPVQNEKYCRLTNVAWDIDLTTVSSLSHGQVINDFVAQAFACLSSPQNGHIRIIQTGCTKKASPIAVIGAGTGLGHCALLLSPCGQWLPFPSEAGSTLFSFWGEEEREFARFFLAQNKGLPPRADQIVSGQGLGLVHTFFTGSTKKPEDFIHEIRPGCPTTALFSRFYGRACRQYALTVMPGRLFISGGIAAKNPFFLEHKNFLEELHNCPKHKQFLQTLPVSLLTVKEPGLFGAAVYAQQATN